MSTAENTFTVTPDNSLTILNADGQKQMTIEASAAEGGQYFTLYLHNGDLNGLRNIQGGNIDTGQADDINLDIASGSKEHPGWVNFTPDIGKGTRFLDARGNEMIRFSTINSSAIPNAHFTAPTYLRRAYVYDPTTKNWKRLYA